MNTNVRVMILMGGHTDTHTTHTHTHAKAVMKVMARCYLGNSMAKIQAQKV